MKKTAVFMLCVLLVLLSSCSKLESLTSFEELSPNTDSAKLSVHFIDVGQGDCTLLESDGEFVLIDAGEADCAQTVLNYTEKLRADKLKYVIATHPHSDHYGGLRKVISAIDTENFITAETDCNTEPWIKLLRTVDSENINYIDAKTDSSYSFGNAEMTVLAPNSDNYDGYNNYSVVTKVKCGEISFVLAGDAEKESEFEMIDAGANLDADVLKLGHHGSSTSSSVAFLQAVNPAFAVISCAENNSYGHPHTETSEKLSELGCTCFRTDKQGTVVAKTDGESLSFTVSKGSTDVPAYHAGTVKNPDSALCYIANKRSGYFHESCCSGTKTMSEKNKVYLDSRNEAVNAGYKPCPSCNP